MDFIGTDLHKTSIRVCILTKVIVADPDFAPMYATRDRGIKTDKRDVRALCEACRLGAYRRAHRTSEPAAGCQGPPVGEETLIRIRSKYTSLTGALARCEGRRIKAGPHRLRRRATPPAS